MICLTRPSRFINDILKPELRDDGARNKDTCTFVHCSDGFDMYVNSQVSYI